MSSDLFFLRRGRRLSAPTRKCALSTDAWLLALRLRDGARARALAEPRRITEAMRGVESAMVCRFILLLQSSTGSCRSESDDSAVVAQLLWLLCERS